MAASMLLHVGDEFSSFEAVLNAIQAFEAEQKVTYWRRDSRTLSGVQKRGYAVPDNTEIKYYEMKFACVKGGKDYKSKSSGRRPNQSTFRDGCQSFVHLRATKDAKKLVVINLNTEHNHQSTDETFQFMPKCRRLNSEETAEVNQILKTRPNKKILQDHVRNTYGKKLTLRDLKNLSAKLKGPAKDLEASLKGICERQDEGTEVAKFNRKDSGKEKPLNHIVQKNSNSVLGLEHEFDMESQHDNEPTLELEPEGDIVYIKEEMEDEYYEMGYEGAPVRNADVKNELGNGYDGRGETENGEIEIKEEAIELKEEPSEMQEKRGEKRPVHSPSSSSSNSKKQRTEVADECEDTVWVVEFNPKEEPSSVEKESDSGHEQHDRVNTAVAEETEDESDRPGYEDDDPTKDAGLIEVRNWSSAVPPSPSSSASSSALSSPPVRPPNNPRLTLLDAPKSIKGRKAIPLKVKLDIITKKEAGERTSNLSAQFGLAKSTIATIVKMKDQWKDLALKCPGQATGKSITKKRQPVHTEMEELLSIWIEEQNQNHVPLSGNLIREKARHIYTDVYNLHVREQGSDSETGASPTSEPSTFSGSWGWLHRFKKRYNLNYIRIQGETASADIAAVVSFPEEFKKIVEEGGYTTQQVFNYDETGLFYKKMPNRTYISRQEGQAPGFRAAKQRVTLCLGANAAGDFKLKPLLIHTAENPRVLKNVCKTSLPVVYRSNKRALMTSVLNVDYLLSVVSPSISEYNKRNNLDDKALIVVDNASAHSIEMVHCCKNLKIVFLPPNTTSVLQPMDQGVIATFKAHYLRRVMRHIIHQVDVPDGPSLVKAWKSFNIKHVMQFIFEAWDELTISDMNAVWKNLWPEAVQNFTGFPEVAPIRREIVTLAEDAGIEGVDDDGVNEVLQSHSEELTKEELQELVQHMNQEEEEEEEAADGDDDEPGLTLQDLHEFFGLVRQAKEILMKKDINMERTLAVTRGMEECTRPLRILQTEFVKQMRQPALDRYFRCYGLGI